MLLVLCEKPSVGRSIARTLGASEHKEGYMEGNGYIVSWCVGHLVGLAPADRYGQRYLRWAREDLPILPNPWQFCIKPDAGKQFGILKGLMERPDVSHVVNACDAGREGELIFRLVYQMAGCSKPFKRLWISSMEEEAIREGFEGLRPGAEYDCLYEAALCRAKADWLVGINATRLFTTLYQGKALHVGRVMTPTLSLLAGREREIAGFKKEKFYTVELELGDFKASSGRIQSRTEAEKLRRGCLGRQAVVQKVERQEKTERQPELFDLTSLQREANRIYGYTAQETLDYLQSLYEKKLATYPRTDSRYLTGDMAGTVGPLCMALAKAFPFAAGFSGKVEAGQVINNAKVSDHHAILPTKEAAKADFQALPTGERNLLSLVTQRLLCGVHPEAYVAAAVAARLSCNGTEFVAKGKEEISEGWKAVERAFMTALKKKPQESLGGGKRKDAALLELAEGLCFTAGEAMLREGVTSPPEHYTEGSLLAAMERAGAGDMADDVERKGLGTPATRAGIIEKLVKAGFVKRDKAAGRAAGRLVPTGEGMGLDGALPDLVKSAKLTADWENALALVAKGELAAGDFMAGIEGMVWELVNTSREAGQEQKRMFARTKNVLGKCPNCGGEAVSGKYGAYCLNKCGMILGRVFGAALTDAQVGELLAGKKILLKGLKSREGKSYDAYVSPVGTEEYSYTKDGEERSGVRFKVDLEYVR